MSGRDSVDDDVCSKTVMRSIKCHEKEGGGTVCEHMKRVFRQCPGKPLVTCLYNSEPLIYLSLLIGRNHGRTKSRGAYWEIRFPLPDFHSGNLDFYHSGSPVELTSM